MFFVSTMALLTIYLKAGGTCWKAGPRPIANPVNSAHSSNPSFIPVASQCWKMKSPGESFSSYIRLVPSLKAGGWRMCLVAPRLGTRWDDWMKPLLPGASSCTSSVPAPRWKHPACSGITPASSLGFPPMEVGAREGKVAGDGGECLDLIPAESQEQTGMHIQSSKPENSCKSHSLRIVLQPGPSLVFFMTDHLHTHILLPWGTSSPPPASSLMAPPSFLSGLFNGPVLGFQDATCG